MEGGFIEAITCHHILDSRGPILCRVKMQPGFRLSVSLCSQRHQGSWRCLCHGGILFLHCLSWPRLNSNPVEVPVPNHVSDLISAESPQPLRCTAARSTVHTAVALPLGHYFLQRRNTLRKSSFLSMWRTSQQTLQRWLLTLKEFLN